MGVFSKKDNTEVNKVVKSEKYSLFKKRVKAVTLKYNFTFD